jgi:hypothetical protein
LLDPREGRGAPASTAQLLERCAFHGVPRASGLGAEHTGELACEALLQDVALGWGPAVDELDAARGIVTFRRYRPPLRLDDDARQLMATLPTRAARLTWASLASHASSLRQLIAARVLSTQPS